jgi:hypothetical protein
MILFLRGWCKTSAEFDFDVTVLQQKGINSWNATLIKCGDSERLGEGEGERERERERERNVKTKCNVNAIMQQIKQNK